ncbi:uncharacterized protein DFL_000810 [Arthrobotrys flagrans]|uniref:Uncharacterized protein n=1 Tax=Arthrobotrys flagrans TaxID=97331 RepID=A0A437AFL2_ARTFL|nr:hypothetical protein DFL_000810 [Arthrobotrys flagrans]
MPSVVGVESSQIEHRRARLCANVRALSESFSVLAPGQRSVLSLPIDRPTAGSFATPLQPAPNLSSHRFPPTIDTFPKPPAASQVVCLTNRQVLDPRSLATKSVTCRVNRRGEQHYPRGRTPHVLSRDLSSAYHAQLHQDSKSSQLGKTDIRLLPTLSYHPFTQ